MAGSFSNYLENALLDHALGGGNYTRPATVYIALFTVAPSDAGGGTEVSGNNYSRAAVTNDATNFPAASGGAKSNGVAITFATPSGSWGTVVAMGVFDASSSGNLLAWADLAASKTVGSGDVVTFPVGDLDVTLD
jgi:hypothetical protein